MTSNEIRNTFLKFFESKGHTIVPSTPIVVKNDPTLMFTNAGMNQFKDIFLGNEAPKHKRVVDTQKCLRVSGKHNDLEEVGVDTYHHTMFEMLGNWSFGDYFKKEAIEWAWELLTDVYKLDKDRLYVTYFEGDEKEGLPIDQEAYDEWKKWIPIHCILPGNKKDNFWEMGDTGPCGPCSEIHVDLRSDEERKNVSGATLVNNDHPQVIEIWNNVFMEFNRKADGSLEKLPAKHVDTGMGFERLVRAIEGKSSNYDTDVFMPYIQFIEKATGIKYGSDEKTDIAMRVLSDHIRTIAFAIIDGQLPSNNGAGYVIRRILRRAVRYYYSILSVKEPFLYKLLPIMGESFKDIFPEVKQKKDFVENVILEEEKAFLRTLRIGIIYLEFYLSTGKRMSDVSSGWTLKANEVTDDIRKSNSGKFVEGNYAFELYDTFGFPIDLTQLVANEFGWSVDLDGFYVALQQQKERSRKATAMETDDWVLLQENEKIEFVGYDELEKEIQITRYRKVKTKGKEQFQLIFNTTPFYAESGGQVGDTGTIESINEKLIIVDTQKENNLIIHLAERLPENPNAVFDAKVDSTKRKLTENNHSATHLLHAALRRVLGTHVEQKGSLVNADHLRFDFSHFKAMTDEEIAEVEHIVNTKIRENLPLDERRNVPIEEAKKLGAMALFGEKYGDIVRVITFDENYSRELCGGCHVRATGQIGYFKLTSESAVAAGVRRIEAITADKVEALINEYESTIDGLKNLLKSKDILKSVQGLLDEHTGLQKKLEVYELEKTVVIKDLLLKKVKQIGDLNVVAEIVSVPNPDMLKNLCFQLKQQIENAYIVLGSEFEGKCNLHIMIDEKVVKDKNLHAGNIVKEAGKAINGGGGGQPFYASAGGTNPAGLKEALLLALSKIG
ncbi:MAG: alanine--tRNA ligase [Flavobacteriaceae bacterium]|nr:alanine--tRNA ligase [Flavobacteriaceae bacterium]